MTSFLLNKDSIEVRFNIPEPTIKTSGTIVGADQGINHVITLSDSQQSQADIHGHTLNSIIEKIITRKNGSKAREKAKEHQKNYINYSINKLNLTNIKQVNLEKISNFRYKNNCGKFLNQFNATLIKSKVIDYCISHGVHVVEQSSPHRSQRCFKCGYVNEDNRNGEQFTCLSCSYKEQSDINAAKNHEIVLPDSMFLLKCPNKPKEFYWKPEGFYYMDNTEFTVPSRNKSI